MMWVGLMIGVGQLANAEPCEEEFQCTTEDKVKCENSQGDCELVECDFIRCGPIKINLKNCPTCPPNPR
jgi:hypothetical protein